MVLHVELWKTRGLLKNGLLIQMHRWDLTWYEWVDRCRVIVCF